MNYFGTRLRNRAKKVAEAAPRPRSGRRPSASGQTASLTGLFPQLPRHATAADLRALAKILTANAVRDEFAREGLRYVDLPDQWTRNDLREARIPESDAFQRFASVTLDSLSFDDPEVNGEREIEAMMDEPSSADAFGPTLEAASAAAIFLVARALDLDGNTRGEGGAAKPDLLSSLLEELEGLRKEADRQLMKMVTVPQEARQAFERASALGSTPPETGDEPSAHENPAGSAGASSSSSRPSFTWSRPTGSARSSSGSSSSSASSSTDSSAGSDDDAGMSMSDLLEQAAKVQAFLSTKEGQQAMKVAGTAFTVGRQYLKKRRP